MKKKLKWLEQPSSASVPIEPDSDFDEPIKPRKAPTKPSTPASQKATPRLQACGEKQLDRCVMAARDNGPSAHVTIVSLSLRIHSDGGADSTWLAEQRDGTAYDLCPPHEKDQKELGESEFLGFFFVNVCSPGVGDLIAEQLLKNDDDHIIVVDPSPKGENFSRFAAGVAAIKARLRNPELGKLLVKTLPKPKDSILKKALVTAAKCRTDAELRGKMTNYYTEFL